MIYAVVVGAWLFMAGFVVEETSPDDWLQMAIAIVLAPLFAPYFFGQATASFFHKRI